MSETTTPTLPNFSTSPMSRTVNGRQVDVVVVKYGAAANAPELPAHTIEVKRLDMGDQFDLAEISGAQTDNVLWMNMAIVAASVQVIDGKPLPSRLTKPGLRDVLRELGADGVRAVSLALNPPGDAAPGEEPVTADEQFRATAGN